MKIYFCDLCNESVPNADLENGRAVMRNGRVICRACEGAMSSPDEAKGSEIASEEEEARTSGSVAKARPPAGSSPVAAVAVVLATMALLATFAAAAIQFLNTDKRLRTLEDELGEARRDAVADGRAMESRLNDEVRRTLDDIGQARTNLVELRARLDESSKAQGDAVARLRDELVEWEARLRELEGVAQMVDRHDRELATVRDKTDTLRHDLRRVGDRVTEQKERAEEKARFEQVIGLGQEEKPEWWSLVSELKSDNSGVRWQAVQSLGATKDVNVAEHLTPMLKDPDIFVRMATARILGDLQATIGIPALIDALEDPEASVREASIVSLRGVTGQNFRFDPSGKDSERAKRVKAWRDWWDKSADDLLGS